MTTTLLPAVVETAIKPKPTKDEILTAMAHLHIERMKKENEARKKTQEELNAKIEKLIVGMAKKNKGTLKESVSFRYYGSGDHSASVYFYFKKEHFTPELIALMKQCQESSPYCIPCISEAKKQVRENMGQLVDKDDRVNALLTDKASRKALEAALDAMEK